MYIYSLLQLCAMVLPFGESCTCVSDRLCHGDGPDGIGRIQLYGYSNTIPGTTPVNICFFLLRRMIYVLAWQVIYLHARAGGRGGKRVRLYTDIIFTDILLSKMRFINVFTVKISY